MTITTINYQQIYEQEVSETIKTSLEYSGRFYDLSNQHRMLIEELVDIGYRRAIEEVLSPEVLGDTAALAGEMGTQLYNFANMIHTYLEEQDREDQIDGC